MSGEDLQPHPRAKFDTLMVQLSLQPYDGFYEGIIRVCGDHIAIRLLGEDPIAEVLVILNRVSGEKVLVSIHCQLKRLGAQKL